MNARTWRTTVASSLKLARILISSRQQTDQSWHGEHPGGLPLPGSRGLATTPPVSTLLEVLLKELDIAILCNRDPRSSAQWRGLATDVAEMAAKKAAEEGEAAATPEAATFGESESSAQAA